MWRSVTRIVFVLMVTAVGASLLIGTVHTERSVPEALILEPLAIGGLICQTFTASPPSSGGVVEHGSVDVRMVTVPSA